ncbi:MAG TPA: hypothetical protein VHF25_16535 [Nitriliruptorales bacterium]|nr:hypothetical protein [Nitriliruptorales bacterium]
MSDRGNVAMEDLSAEALAEALPGREVRSYPAMLSTEADALAWARSGAPSGAVVVADYQASPRGRAGRPWQVRPPGQGLGFSVVLRPQLPPEREGWLYTVAVSALADVAEQRGTSDDAEPEVGILWPDEVVDRGTRAGAVGVYVELGPDRLEWAVATFLVEWARPPRGPLLATLLDELERRVSSGPEAVLADYTPRCVTFGRQVKARLIPMGPAGPTITGVAVDTLADGALVIATAAGRRVAVPPQNLGLLEEAL